MNLNYDNLNLEDISEETKAKYAFPKDKVFLQKYMRGGETLKSKQEEDEEQSKLVWAVSGCCLSFGAGAASYMTLLFPNGKVLRDSYDASLPQWRRVARRVLPFTLMIIPFIVARSYVDRKNFDYKTWKN